MSSEPEQPTEEELRAWEEQMRRITPADVIAQTVVSLVTLAGRRIGLEPGHEDERDLAQVRDAIDGARALMPLLERVDGGARLGPLREALSALQLEYARLAGVAGPPAGGGRGGAAPGGAGGGAGGDGGGGAPGGAAGTPPADGPGTPGESAPGPGPAQRSGRLWVPGS